MTSGDLRRFLERCHAGPATLGDWLAELAPVLGPLVAQREGLLFSSGAAKDVRAQWAARADWAFGRAEVVVPRFALAIRATPQDWRTRALSPFLVTTLSRLFGRTTMRGERLFEPFLGVLGFVDVLGIQARDADVGMWVSIPLRPDDVRSHREPLLHRVRRHLQSGFLARRAASCADVIADPSGRILHDGARGADLMPSDLLARAARAFDAERCGAEADPDAERVWRELFAGGWSLVESVDTDGKRLLLLRRDASTANAASIDARERKILAELARGASYKSIALELGIGVSTASELGAKALRKLGFASRVAFARSLGRRAEAR